VISGNILVQQVMLPIVSDKFSSVCCKFLHCDGKTAVRSSSVIHTLKFDLFNIILEIFLQLLVDIKIDNIEIVVLNHFTCQKNNHSSGN
jgi:hypothetical protein